MGALGRAHPLAMGLLLLLVGGCSGAERKLTNTEVLTRYWELCQQLQVPPFTEDLLKEKGAPHVVGENPWGVYTVAEVQGPVFMMIDVHGGELRVFGNLHSLYLPATNEHSYTPSLSIEEAEQAGRRHIARVQGRVPDDLILIKLKFQDHDGYWFAVFAQTHNGYKKDGFLDVWFDEKGTLLHYNNSLQPCDCPTEIRVPEQQAVAAAQKAAQKALRMYDWLRHYERLVRQPLKGWVGEEQSQLGPALHIVSANEFLSDPKSFKEPYVFKPRPCRLAYIIQFRAMRNDSDEPYSWVTIFVDAITGEAIGGFY